MTRLFHIDEPGNRTVSAPAVAVRGWIIDGAVREIGAMSLRSRAGADVPLRAADRPDVRARAAGAASTGFEGWIDITSAAHGPWQLRYEHDRGRSGFALDLSADRDALDRFTAAKARKLAALRPLLRCPACAAPLDERAGAVRCANGHTFPARDRAYHLLDAATRELAGVVDTDNVSAHGYDPTVLEMIAGATGPVLDVGAGLRPDYRADVVNLDVVAYPTTDVVAASEHLPFADDTFDLVISVAVLEHVRDPFRAAAELVRVMRPGGRIYAAVPFLQPYHGYPNHYYNMTSTGLRNLFAALDVERVDVPAGGLPVFALTWLLQSWRRALPPHLVGEFDALTVAELCVDPHALIDRPFVRALPPAVNDELAALNVLIGRKRGAGLSAPGP